MREVGEGGEGRRRRKGEGFGWEREGFGERWEGWGRVAHSNLCGNLFKVGKSLHRGNPTLSASEARPRWYGRSVTTRDFFGCRSCRQGLLCFPRPP